MPETVSMPAPMLAAVVRLQRDVARTSLDVERVMRAVVDRLHDLFAHDGAVVELKSGDWLEYRATSGALFESALGLRLEIARSLSGLCVRTGQAQLCSDAELDSRVDRAACQRLGIRSMVIAPLASPRGVLGTLKAVSTKSYAFGTVEENALALVAEALATALHNATLIKEREEALRSALDAQQKTSRELHMLSEAIENSLNGFDIVDAQGRFVYANRAYLDMWGYESLDEVRGTSAADHCADPETPAKIIAELKQKGECTIEFVGRRKDGTTFDVRMWARLAYDVDGKEIYPSTSVDVTKRNQNEARLHEAIRSRDEFLSIASHELKTPLTAMRLQLEMRARKLIAGDDAYFARAQLQKMVDADMRQVARLARLIDDMLDIARIDTGKLSVRCERFDLGDLAEEVIERHAAQLAEAATPVRFVRDADAEGTWDRFRVEQAFTNLLTNAMKYGRGRPIDVAVRRVDGHADLVVRDRGRGVAAQDHARIFERFERAVSANDVSGLGLGLFVVREVARMHGGSVAVESELDHGATFTLSLPLSS